MAINAYEMPPGRRRPDVEPPETQPDVDFEAVLAVSDWRKDFYKQPILDQLIGYYRFSPPTLNTAGSYIRSYSDRSDVREAIESVQAYNDDRSAVPIKVRQVIHRAESLELALAVFGSVARLRELALTEVLSNVNNQQESSKAALRYAADAITDFGLCMENPFESERDYMDSQRPGMTPGVTMAMRDFAPGVGTQVASFGAYALKHPEALYSHDGVVLLDVTIDEQEYRQQAWLPRHKILMSLMPDLQQSKEILELQKPLDEMLELQDRLLNE